MSDDTDFADLKPVANAPSGVPSVTSFLLAAYTVAVPIYLFHAILYLPVEENFILFAIGTLVGSFVLARAYQTVSFWRGVRLNHQRERVVTVANVADFKSKDEKKQYLQNKRDEQEQLTNREATAYSYFINNAVFLGVVLASSLLIFTKSAPTINYVLSIALASGATYFFSSTQK